ncbi:hypothetical protein AKJ58_01465 [candidate division MSBL1 archaeon SCGC-AAA385D11]|uniref:DUF35 domain-containing protein n=1 Tax=candidate division MSBL1 archaeon SCGC-AAA385D11 TaxID=1698286 RepID=A0A133VN72_9EURY|nr:hypothetical protein AKJ58_01465 [candidate division MSBL1 archaeon SCGC-AAA385D11]
MEGIKCRGCGRLYVPPMMTCISCGSNEFDRVEFEGKGNIVTYTVIHVPTREYKDEAPYTVAIIELEEGAKITGRVKGDPEKLAIGKSVKLLSEGKYYLFELVTS